MVVLEMNKRILSIVSALMVLHVVPSLQYEPVFNVDLYQHVLQPVECEQHIEILRTRPTLLQQFTDASADIPRDAMKKDISEFRGDLTRCLSIDEDIDGTVLQGKYAEVSVEVHKQRDDLSGYETLRKIVEEYEGRTPYRMIYGIGCKENFPRKPTLKYKNTTTLTLGVCIPKPCSAAEAADIVLDTEYISLLTNDNHTNQRKYTEKIIRLPYDIPFSTADYYFVLVLSCIILLSITSTVYDIRNITTESSKIDSLYRTFSLHKNARQLLRVSSSKDTVGCVDGIRALAMMLIIWLHCYYIVDMITYAPNPIDFQHIIIPFATYGVDSFFLLGGIFNIYTTVNKYTQEPDDVELGEPVGTQNLNKSVNGLPGVICYHTMHASKAHIITEAARAASFPKPEIHGSFLSNLHMHFFNRLVRLYPVLCFGVLAQASIMSHFPGDLAGVDDCRASWWIVLLYIQNIVHQCGPERVMACMGETWYLAVDMQLFVISTLVLMWTFGKKRTAWTALSIAVILSLSASTVLSFLYNFRFNFIRNAYEHVDYLSTHYTNPLTRAPPYFIGMLIGYLLYCYKHQRLSSNTNKVWIWSLWCFTILLFVVIIAGLTVWSKLENQWLHNIMNSYWSSLWSVAVSWIIVACHHGCGGPVNWFLSLKQWKLLSRLSYCMYILHRRIIQLVYEATTRNVDGVLRKTDFVVIQVFLCALLACLIVSFVVTLLIEMPVINLNKLAQGTVKSGIYNKEELKHIQQDLNVTSL